MGIGYETYRSYLKNLVEALIAEFGEKNLLACALFGSVARGEARPESDIDLFILHCPLDFSCREKFLDIRFALEAGEEYQKLLKQGLFPHPSAIFKTEEALVENPLILLDVLDHGLILHDLKERLGALLGRLEEVLGRLGAEKVVLADGSWAWDLKPDWRPGEIIEVRL